jgi:hypothetical protein
MPRPATLETLRAAFERSGHPSAAFRARALACRLGVAVPDWAVLRKPRRQTLDLESLRERHDRASVPASRRARLRMLARERAEAAGVPVPEWAKTPPRVPSPKAPLAVPPAAKAGQPRATAPRMIAKARRSIFNPYPRPKKMLAASTPTSREIPAPLRTWLEAHASRVVQMTGERVTLHEHGARCRSFASVAEAIVAITSHAPT